MWDKLILIRSSGLKDRINVLTFQLSCLFVAYIAGYLARLRIDLMISTIKKVVT
jgi:hypothetical protein